MGTFLTFILGSTGKIYALLSSVGIFVYTYLVNRNAKLHVENKVLAKDLEDIQIEAGNIIDIQRKQAQIASMPPSSRDDLYNELRQIAQRGSKNKH